MEKGLIRVFGKTVHGYMRYVIEAVEDVVKLTIEKAPEKGGEKILFPLELNGIFGSNERLSLGMHKAQEWEKIHTRLDFREIFPIWMRLASWVPSSSATSQTGNFQLLEKCRQESTLKAFESLFLAAFEGVLVPRLIDTDYQGINVPVPDSKLNPISPLPLLREVGELIRSLFFQENPEEFEILPLLPPEFHCGRMTGVETSEGHLLDFEWTKRKLRRLRLISPKGGEVCLQLPKGLKTCRIKLGRKTLKESSGKIKLELKSNEIIHLDRFE